MGIHSLGLHYEWFDVFPLSFRLRMEVFCVGNVDQSEEVVHDIITANILRCMREYFPVLISLLRDELISIIDEKLRVLLPDLGGQPSKGSIGFV